MTQTARELLGIPPGPISVELEAEIQQHAVDAADIYDPQEFPEAHARCLQGLYWSAQLARGAGEAQESEAMEMLAQADLLPQSEPAPQESAPQARPRHRVWRAFLSGDLCGQFAIVHADLPYEQREMRQLLAKRLQDFGDAVMAEWEKVEGGLYEWAQKEV